MLEESLIAKVYSLGRMWKPNADGFLISQFYLNLADGVTTKYTKAELVAIHPRLYDAALVLANDVSAFSTSQLVDNIKRLHCSLHIEDNFGNMISIYDISEVTIHADMISFGGLAYLYRDCMQMHQSTWPS